MVESIENGPKAVNNEDIKGANSDDTGRTERSSREHRGLGKENESEGTNVQISSENSNAERGMGKEHLVPVERTTLLRSGKDKNDGQIRESNSGNLRDSGSSTKDEVQLYASDSDKRGDSGRTGVSSARGTIGGGNDASSRNTRHADGSTESVGRNSDNDERTGSGQPDEQTERVEQRPKPETIRRGRFYSTEEARQAFTEETQSAGRRMGCNKKAINTCDGWKKSKRIPWAVRYAHKQRL